MDMKIDRPAPTTPADPLVAKATQAAEKFEAFFVKDMLSRMRSSSRSLGGGDETTQGRSGAELLDLADGLVADVLAGRHAFGIADLMLRQVLPSLRDLSAGGSASSFPQEPSAQEPR